MTQITTITPAPVQIGGGITNVTRPTKLDEVIGMEDVKRTIRYHIEGGKLLNEPWPSWIIQGPPGTGKSTIAGIIATMTSTDATVYKCLGSDITKPEQIHDLALMLKDGDVLFIEEAHTIGAGSKYSKICQSIFYEWIENFAIPSLNGVAAVQAPKASIVFATTEPGRLTTALFTRCQKLTTRFSTEAEMKMILTQAGRKVTPAIDLTTDQDALTLLSRCSRGTPRIGVLNRLGMLRKVLAVDKLQFNHESVKHFLKMNNINEWGLEASDLTYMNVLFARGEESNGRPASLKTLAQSTGMSDNLIEGTIEPYLQQIGAIKIDSRGRSLTNFGHDIIAKTPVITTSTYKIDLVALKAICNNPHQAKLGMKYIMPKLGLRYGPDNGFMQIKLHEIGFVAKRHIGIVPVPGTIKENTDETIQWT